VEPQVLRQDMKKLKVGNAPCSWGMLEFDETKGGGEQIQFERMLDELVEAGYTGTELGDWGYMPTGPVELASQLARRGLTMLGAFVPVALKDSAAHEAGIAAAVKTARLLAAVAGEETPFLVLADANGTDATRTQMAGRITANLGLSLADWKTFASGADRVARAVLDETGLRTVFHHHCAGYVETPYEITTLLELTDPERLGLVFDTGHFRYGAGAMECDMVAFMDRIADRVWYIHCKDCEAEVARRARVAQWDYFTALSHGVFCELGNGAVDFPALLHWLARRRYEHYVVVEQDILPGMGTPRESARRNRNYLKSIEANFA
jgi:inosose dehydratase